MLFCAYCGKSFTRKEHLERHIPSHTNVKPHRCGSCQLSFSRRDLLQRHHSTYHEIRDPTQPLTSAVPTLAGRTPIACMNCASAKTGCDKQVPCSRCAEKNLPCAARFARRASKILRRMATTQDQATLPVHATSLSPQRHGALQSSVPVNFHPNNHIDQYGPILQSPYTEIQKPSNVLEAPSSSSFLDNDYLHYTTDFSQSDVQYHDYLQWADFTIDPNMYMSDMISPELGKPFYSDQELSSGSENGCMSSYACLTPSHSRNTSIRSITELNSPSQPKLMVPSPLQQAILEGEAAWPLARCHFPEYSGTCPRTALLHLENLEYSSRHEDCWTILEEDTGPTFRVAPIRSQTRDTILAITQGVLQRALNTHRGSTNDRRMATTPASQFSSNMTYLALPSTRILDVFLQKYMRSLSLENTTVSTGVLDINDLAFRNQGSTLLVLLMIAQGASRTNSEEARSLASGLTEMCRITLFDMIEKDVELVADQAILSSALIFTSLGAWSGDKWHMDIAMGQRGMYLAMLKHSGALEKQVMSFPAVEANVDAELCWRSWLYMESTNRLVYDWVALDLELSLFFDTAPILQLSDLDARMPNSDALWVAESAESWLHTVHTMYPSSTNIPNMHPLPATLSELFQDFLLGNIDASQQPLSLTQLRLLLHPIQSLIHQTRQILCCFPDILVSSPQVRGDQTTRPQLTRQVTLTRLEEIQSLLLRWYDLYKATISSTAVTPLTSTTLLLYHLLSLSLTTSISDIEKLARKDGFDNTYWDLSLRHKKCVQNSTEAIFHAGQILRVLKVMLVSDRPAWWSLAVYRVALVLWIDGLAQADPNFSQAQQHSSMSPIVVDTLDAEDPLLNAWRWGGIGSCVLSRGDGSMVSVSNPEEVLEYCIGVLRDGDCGERLVGGIRRKLIRLRGEWHGNGALAVGG